MPHAKTDDKGASDVRAHKARLANMRQELIAPVTAIIGYGEIIVEEAQKRSFDQMRTDVERIMTSARALYHLVDCLLDHDAVVNLSDGSVLTDAQSALRHDLRTPLNHIKGYGEMLLEDIDGMGAGELRPDLQRMLAEADNLLTQIDIIIDFSGNDAEPAEASQSLAMITDLLRVIRPVSNAAEEEETSHGLILVVDDNQTNRDLVSRRLVRDGHQIVTAEGGREALALVAEQAFDIILLDLMMPEMNGYEVLAALKSEDRTRHIPVIMISALNEVDTVIRCIEAGAEDYLTKPFNPILLKARINACLEKKRFRDRERLYLDRLQLEMEKNEQLLLAILPRKIVGRLNEGESVIADSFEDVTVLFSDLVGFTSISSMLSPIQLVENLNRLFSEFDMLTRKIGVEKVKTIGDAYMVVAGVPEPRPDHVEAIADMALSMVQAVKRINRTLDHRFDIRIGIHTGPVVAGIIGTHRFVYDVWGDTVNLASRFESYSEANRIHVSGAVAEKLADKFIFESRGIMDIRGKGKIETYFLNGRR